MQRLEAALGQGPEPLPDVDEETFTAIGRAFVESEARPEVTAVTFVAAYWQRGAPLDLAVGLWFPLLTMSHDARRGLVWSIASRDREGSQVKSRRLRTVEAARAHLFGNGAAADLPLAVLAAPAPVYDRSGSYFGSHIEAGTAIEVLSEKDGLWEVRSGDDLRSSLTPARAARLRILPGD